jgi:type III secretory pathway component EscU
MRFIVLTVAILFVTAMTLLTVDDFAQNGVTGLGVVGAIVVVILGVGVIGAFLAPPKE